MPLLRLIYWSALKALLHSKHSKLIAYAIGIFFGWVLCSEYNVYLETGKITTFPWE